MRPVLLSRVLDPILGLFTGCLAYYLYENNPRTAIPPDQKLRELLQWKMDKRKGEHIDKGPDTTEDVEWK
ncbi:hypothetical protein OF83DRAFT_1094917 [Amylostereum chailletii]|nr:hypothetical protein OF83DRAFT_1094917 [Amylostereum chailletii]